MRRTNELTGQERRQLKTIIFERTGYHFESNTLLLQAFTRSSYSAEQGGESNEILEFIGDQVLSYYVVKIASARCGAKNNNGEFSFRARENRFHTLKQELIHNESLASIIDDWGVAEYLIVGKSDFSNEVDKQPKVKADLLEAILGAIAVASNWDSVVLEQTVSKMLDIDEKISAIIETDHRPVQFDMENAVNTLKELAEHGGCSVPEYAFAGPEQVGYDKDGNPIWCCTCSVVNDKTGIIRQVWGSSKKTVKKCAAYLVLCEHYEVQNEYGTNRIVGGSPVFKYKNGKLMPMGTGFLKEMSENAE